MAKKFWKVNIEIGNICNLQCSFCPEVIRTKKIMTPSVFETVAKQVAQHTKLVALHLMGDPLVHPNLAEIVDICASLKLKIFLVTNGLLLREKEMELLLHPAFHQISFSLHSFPDNFPKKDPSIYLDRIFKFTETAFEKRPKLFINYRLWNLADPLGHTTNNRQILAKVEERFGVTVPEFDIRERKNIVLKNYLSLHFDSEFIWPNLDLPLLHSEGSCQGLSSHFGVLADGTVVPCCLDKEGVIALGNVQERPIADILASARAQKMISGFRSGKLVEELCRRCNYIERFKKESPAVAPL